MDRAIFREAAGAFEGTTLRYGDEGVDLRAIRDVIRRVEARTTPRLNERLMIKFGVSVSPPSESPNTAVD